MFLGALGISGIGYCVTCPIVWNGLHWFTRCRHAGQYIHQGAIFNSLDVFLKIGCNMKTAGPRGLAVEGVGLGPLACWACGFESRRRHGCLSFVSFVCGQVEVCASGWSLVQRSPTECGVSECDHESSIVRKRWPTGGGGGLLRHIKNISI